MKIDSERLMDKFEELQGEKLPERMENLMRNFCEALELELETAGAEAVPDIPRGVRAGTVHVEPEVVFDTSDIEGVGIISYCPQCGKPRDDKGWCHRCGCGAP